MSAAVLAPANSVSMPAFAQVQQKASRGQKRKSEESAGDKPAKKYTVQVRRKPGDFIPGPTGNEEVDVERRWLWVHRGSCKPRDRLINFHGVRNMDIDEAYEMLQHDKRQRAMTAALLPTPSPDEVAAQMTPLRPQLSPQQAGYIQPPAMGLQYPFFNTAGPLQPQFFGVQDLPLNPPQAAMPVLQEPVAVLQQTDFLQGEDLFFGPGFLPPDLPPFDPLQDTVNDPEVAGDLRAGLAAPNGAVGESMEPSGFQLTPPESREDWVRRFLGEGHLGLEAQMGEEQGEGEAAVQNAVPITEVQQDAEGEVPGEPTFDFSQSDFDALFNFGD